MGHEKLGHYIRKKINGRKIMGLPRRFAPRNDRKGGMGMTEKKGRVQWEETTKKHGSLTEFQNL